MMNVGNARVEGIISPEEEREAEEASREEEGVAMEQTKRIKIVGPDDVSEEA